MGTGVISACGSSGRRAQGLKGKAHSSSLFSDAQGVLMCGASPAFELCPFLLFKLIPKTEFILQPWANPSSFLANKKNVLTCMS